MLTDAASLVHLGPLARLFAATGAQTGALLEAYRTGGGVSWEQFGDDARESQADLNRAWFGELAGAFSGVAELDDVLARPGARIADVGMGGGWSSIELAKAYPGLRVDGFDVDEPSIALARANASEAGVADRVEFHNADGDGLERYGPFDAAFAFECIHDLPRPVEVLEAMRRAVREGGPVIIMDEAVADRLVAPGDELERLMYGLSLFCCLPDGCRISRASARGRSCVRASCSAMRRRRGSPISRSSRSRTSASSGSTHCCTDRSEPVPFVWANGRCTRARCTPSPTQTDPWAQPARPSSAASSSRVCRRPGAASIGSSS